MSKRARITAAVVALAMVAMIGTIAAAQNAGGGMGKAMGALQGIERLVQNPDVVEQAGLTDSQVEKISGLSKEASKQRVRIQADIQVYQIDLVDLIEQDNPDRAQIESLVEKIGDKNTQSQKLMINTLLDIKEILTDEQIEKIKEYAAQQKGRKGNRGGRGNLGMGGPGVPRTPGPEKPRAQRPEL